MSSKNNKQDIEIVKLRSELDDFKCLFKKFVSNDFLHLRDKVDKIEDKILYGFILVIAATLIAQIALRFFK